MPETSKYNIRSEVTQIIETNTGTVIGKNDAQPQRPNHLSGDRTILFLAASPTDRPRLRLDEEARIVTEALQRSDYGDRFELKQHWAVRPEDLHSLLPRLNPHIVYFCCHGEAEGLALDNGNGKTQLVSTKTIADYLSHFPTIECVVLNSCYSDKQAEAIVQHIPYVIGMSSDILDKAALKFAQGFYNALGANLSYQAAYDNGKDAIALDGIPQSQIPILKQKSRNC
jgi:CHAT domain